MTYKDTYKLTIDTTLMLKDHPRVLDFCVVGSALYHPEPKDLDFLVLVNAGWFFPENAVRFFPEGAEVTSCGQSARWAFGPEWELCGGEYADQDNSWGAIRKGGVNLILTVDPEWYKRAKLANEVCHALKLMDKGDRIVVYRVVRDGYDAEAANARRDGTR